VSTGDQSDQETLDRRRLADHDLADLGAQRGELLLQ